MKKIFLGVFVVVSLFIIYSLSTSIASLLRKQQLIDNAKRELALEKKKQKALVGQYKKVHSDEFVEQQARDKLYLVRPGEQVVMLPSVAAKKPKVTQTNPAPVYLQWWELFF